MTQVDHIIIPAQEVVNLSRAAIDRKRHGLELLSLFSLSGSRLVVSQRCQALSILYMGYGQIRVEFNCPAVFSFGPFKVPFIFHLDACLGDVSVGDMLI